MNPLKSNPWRLLLISFLLIAGIILITRASQILLTNLKLKKWKTAPGVVTSAGIIKTAGGKSGTHDIYIPDVQYIFYIDGIPHKNNQFALTKTRAASSEEADRWMEGICVGKNIRILYNPHNPAESLIYRNDYTRKLLFNAICGLMLISVAALISISLVRDFARDHDNKH